MSDSSSLRETDAELNSDQAMAGTVRTATPVRSSRSLSLLGELQRRCCVAEGRAGSTPPGPGSDCLCEFGEDRLEPAAGLDVVSEFVVAAA